MKRLLLLVAVACAVTAHAQQVLTVTPSPVYFTNVAIGQSADTTIIATNNLKRTLNSRCYITGPDAADFILMDSVSMQFGPNGSRAIRIRHVPSHGDTSFAQLVFSLDSNITEMPVNLYGIQKPTYPGLEIIPKLVQFQNCIVGHTIDAIFTVNNYSSSTQPVVISFSTPLSTPFTVVSPTSPVTIGANGYASCIVRFSPTQEGAFTGVVNVLANGAVITVPVTATAYPSELKIDWENGDFIADSIGQAVTRTITVTNVGTDSVISVFTSRGMTFKVDPETLYLGQNMSATTTVTFIPTSMDTTTEGLEVVRSRMSEYSLPLVGYVRPKPVVRLHVSDVTGKPGTTQTCSISLLTDIPDKTMSATLTLSFNASVLVPTFETLSDVTVQGIRTVTVQTGVPASRKAGEILIALPFTIAMGDAKNSKITVQNVVWRGVEGIVIPMTTTSDDATTTVDDDREVNTNAGPLTFTLSPNPMTTSATAMLYGATGATTIDVYNTIGLRIYTASVTSAPEGTAMVIDRTALAQGTYLVRISNGTYSVVRRLIVE